MSEVTHQECGGTVAFERRARKWFVVNNRDHFLAEAGKHRGSQAGHARIWSMADRDAMPFASAADAQAFIDREFQRWEIDSYVIHPTGEAWAYVADECTVLVCQRCKSVITSTDDLHPQGAVCGVVFRNVQSQRSAA